MPDVLAGLGGDCTPPPLPPYGGDKEAAAEAEPEYGNIVTLDGGSTRDPTPPPPRPPLPPQTSCYDDVVLTDSSPPVPPQHF